MGLAVLLGIVVLTSVLMSARWYQEADIKTLKRGLAWTGIVLLGAVALFLAATGRIGPALAVLAGVIGWAFRILNLIALGRQFGFGSKGQPNGQQGSQQQGSPSPPASTMAADEAARVLGVSPGASEEEIKTAYRRLMEQLHPDRGGNDYLAAKVNQARDILLKNQRRN